MTKNCFTEIVNIMTPGNSHVSFSKNALFLEQSSSLPLEERNKHKVAFVCDPGFGCYRLKGMSIHV